MTLTTTIALSRTVAPGRVWAMMCELAGSEGRTPAVETSDEDYEQLETPTNIGLLACLRLRWGVTGPLVIWDEGCTPVPPWGNSAWVVLTFDSSGAADDYHAWLVMEMFDWVSCATPARMAWCHDRAGAQWQLDCEGVSALGDPRRGFLIRSAVL